MNLEQRTNIKFCMKLGKSGAETFDMILRAYGNEAMRRARRFEWHARFKRGRSSLEEDKRSGQTSTSSTTKNWKQFGGLCMRILGEPSRTLLQSLMRLIGTLQTILTCDLNMHHVAAKFMPRLLTPKQKEHHVAICQELC
jgi:hypothetical protein